MSIQMAAPAALSPEGASLGEAPRPELARVTVVAPDRRLDVAVPAHARVAELLPGLIARAGDTLADDGEQHGGWQLRTETGTALDSEESLDTQDVRDGQRLYLVPGADDWPEVDYDDVVEAIAQSGKGRLLSWNANATRVAALTVAAVALAWGLVLELSAPVPHAVVGVELLVAGIVLVAAGSVLARALADSGGGAVVAAAGVAHGVVGGLLVSSPPATPLLQVDVVDLLAGSTALLVGSLAAYAGVACGTRLWSAGAVLGAAALGMAVLGITGLSPGATAAVVVAVLTGLLAVFPLVAMRLGRVPVPTLPETADELLADQARPDPAMIRSAVVRADELLTGFLSGAAVATGACVVLLFQHGGVAAPVLALVVAATYGLRSGLFPTVRHKAPLLAVTTVGGLGLLTALPVWSAGLGGLLVGVVLVLLVTVAMLRVAERAGKAKPSPYVSRGAELLEMALVISVLPLAGSVVGLYAFARGLAG
ncbi:MAG: type VII secretion integral membrane protein EccD [Dermatophilaceae bacterium]